MTSRADILSDSRSVRHRGLLRGRSGVELVLLILYILLLQCSVDASVVQNKEGGGQTTLKNISI